MVPAQFLVPTGNFDNYLAKIGRIPVLSAEEEHDLAVRFREEGDLQAAQALVLGHLRYVARIAKQYQGYGLAMADLVQEGTIGLMKAVKRFDPAVGVRLVSFAVHWIKAEMHEFIIRNWRIVRIATTKAQRKLFFNLRSSKKRLGWMNQEEMKIIANDLGVKPEDVMAMEERMNAYDDIAFDHTSADDDDHPLRVPAAYLEAPGLDPMASMAEHEQHAQLDAMRAAIRILDERSRVILETRWLVSEESQKATLKDLAERFGGISIERARQLEQQALKKLQKEMLASS